MAIGVRLALVDGAATHHRSMSRCTLRIGPLVLDTPVVAAPIAGFTDAIFRHVVRDLGGCGLIFTEMIGAGMWMLSRRERPERLEGVEEEPRPLGVQLWDREPEMIYRAAQELAAMGVSVIDLNFGCPKKRIMGAHAAGAIDRHRAISRVRRHA